MLPRLLGFRLPLPRLRLPFPRLRLTGPCFPLGRRALPLVGVGRVCFPLGRRALPLVGVGVTLLLGTGRALLGVGLALLRGVGLGLLAVLVGALLLLTGARLREGLLARLRELDRRREDRRLASTSARKRTSRTSTSSRISHQN